MLQFGDTAGDTTFSPECSIPNEHSGWVLCPVGGDWSIEADTGDGDDGGSMGGLSDNASCPARSR